MRTLTAWRSHFGLTQQRLAELTDTTKGEISRLESGKRRLTVEWLRRFARIYQVAPEALMKPPPDGLADAPGRGGGAARVSPAKTETSSTLLVADDGMAPTLGVGDEVELDLEDRDARTPGLFAIREGDRVAVRRVQQAGGSLRVAFDNPAYRAYDAPVDAVTVVGRAVRRTHKL